ncbi:MAG: altronate dehydratase, partial [Opitutae bacterium]|nr:altronate dehydratase [Opitutae bacterium]
MKVAREDNLVVALRDLNSGEIVEVEGESYKLTKQVSAKHKFADKDFEKGDLATMYGVVVGETTQAVPRGGPLTTENLAHRSAGYGEQTEEMSWNAPDVSRWKDATFNGFHRSDGSVGTSNNWLVIPMVFCENGNVELLREAMLRALGYEQRSHYQKFAQELAESCRTGGDLGSVSLPEEGDHKSSPIFPNVDGVKFLVHGLGCGETRGISNELCGLLAGYANHPNVAGITILSLGCQHAQVSILEEEINKRNPSFDKPLLVYEQQKHASEREMLEQAIRETFEGLRKAN